MKFQQRFLFILTLFIIAFKYTTTQAVADADLWHRLAVGKIFFQLGGILKNDIFSYVATKPVWVDHEWGSGVIFYFLADHFGDYGLLGLKLLILLTILSLIFITNNLISKNKNDFKIGIYAVSLLTIALGFVTTIRCMIFTYLFFTLWIYLLERIRRGENKLIWILPATMFIWVNLHAGFVSGLGLLALYTVGEFMNKKNYSKFVGIFAVCFLATFINPYGIHFWSYIINAVTMHRPYIIEWAPTNLFGAFQEFLAFKMLLLITIVGYLYKFFIKYKNNLQKITIKIDWVAIMVIGVTLILSLKHLRHQVFFGIAASIFGQHHYFYEAIKNLYQKITGNFSSPHIIGKNTAISQIIKTSILNIIILSIAIFYIVITPLNIRANAPEFPAQAVEFIKINHLKGNLLTSFNWGSYALWKLYPQCLIFEDGRYEEVYFNESDNDLDKFIYNKKNWDDIFKKYHHDIILVKNDLELLNRIKSLKTWKIIYKDNDSIIFVPNSLKKESWILPDKKIDYDKTKYLNTINF